MSAAARRAQQARQRYANLLVRSLDESGRAIVDGPGQAGEGRRRTRPR
jgi:hypothetical protein